MKEAEGKGLGKPANPQSIWGHGADDAGQNERYYRTVHTLHGVLLNAG